MSAKDDAIETYSEEETERRREAALKVMLATPHKKQADTKSSGLLKRGRPKTQ
jgi:hypothetical protein